MSFFHPPQGFPPHLAVIWPLIWGQLLLLRAAVRAAYGRGVVYRWSVTPCGRVFVTGFDWVPGQTRTRDWLAPSAYFNDRLAAACDGRAIAPDDACAQPVIPGRLFRRTQSVPLSSRAPGGGLPLPDT